MPDPTDFASDREETERERFIRHQLQVSRANAGVAAIACVNGCGEAPAQNSRFCGPECCADFSERKERERRRGAR